MRSTIHTLSTISEHARNAPRNGRGEGRARIECAPYSMPLSILSKLYSLSCVPAYTTYTSLLCTLSLLSVIVNLSIIRMISPYVSRLPYLAYLQYTTKLRRVREPIIHAFAIVRAACMIRLLLPGIPRNAPLQYRSRRRKLPPRA